MSDANLQSIWIAVVAFALLLWQTGRYLKTRNYVIFLIWPAFIYLIGPAATLMFTEAPVLSRYVDESRIDAQTLLMGWYLVLLVVADKVVNLSSELRKALAGGALHDLSTSRVFPIAYIGAVALASVLQIYILKTFGTILSGTYVLDNNDDIPFWGFLAGLYEIIFLCFIVFLLGKQRSRKTSVFYVCLYGLTTVLRVAGGTRLVLIKEFAFMVLFFYLRGNVSGRKLLAYTALIVAIGSGVGLLRSSGGNDNSTVLGPVYGLVMESSLNALTLSIADSANYDGTVAKSGDTLQAGEFLLLSVVPSFLRFGVNETDMAAISPYNLALSAGFDTSSPVGGMSGFATIDYLTSFPHLFLLLMVCTFVFWYKNLRNGPFKQFVGLVVMTNAIHFWRDPADIAFKLLIQGLVICAVFYVTPPLKRCLRKRAENGHTLAGAQQAPMT